jgi:hypothetical protein
MGLTPEPEEFCRQVESYICRKNEGHLIRIVGPAFEQVCGWARRGMPIAVAQRGIDRYFERYYAKGPRRRPVRVEFCEADVLDSFDEWRRALGIPRAGGEEAGGQGDEEGTGTRHKDTLPAHLERVIARLTSARAGESRVLDAQLDALVRELDGMRATAKGLRGQAREACLDRLVTLDAELIDAAKGVSDAATLAGLERDAGDELKPFRERMLADAFERSRRAGVDRLLRERYRLPILRFE